ncbi:MAG: tRNA threonylcarbamoyladenosine dehydratase [Desulfurispora sp.]|uniref:tRNA threonylcarbamoyladenosine dehydratase n=1 Tax=Desulfurispora sp. TaxID=3014275 RepID=UPI0040493061
MEDIFARTRLLIGQTGVDRLAAAGVAVFGLGGVGSFAVEALARAGVGRLILVDFDRVAPSNINRQLHALTDTVGRYKTDLMAERIARINPRAGVVKICRRYQPGDGAIWGEPPPDYCVDAIDDVEAKVELIKTCLARGVPVISAMGTGNKLNPLALQVADISRTSVCPLARVVRRRLRQEGIGGGVKVVFSPEPPGSVQREEEAANATPGERRPPGSLPFVPPVAGLVMAAEVVRFLLGLPSSG